MRSNEAFSLTNAKSMYACDMYSSNCRNRRPQITIQRLAYYCTPREDARGTIRLWPLPTIRQDQLLPRIAQTTPTRVAINHGLVSADRRGSPEACRCLGGCGR